VCWEDGGLTITKRIEWLYVDSWASVPWISLAINDGAFFYLQNIKRSLTVVPMDFAGLFQSNRSSFVQVLSSNKRTTLENEEAQACSSPHSLRSFGMGL
jgi:hypothetical protein